MPSRAPARSVPGRVFVLPRPNSEPQRAFFKARAKYIAYGGARGGGKTWAAQRKAALLAFNYAGIRVLILRRTFPQLHQKYILELGAQLYGFAKFNKSDKIFFFPNGSTITLGYCDREADAAQYQGREYDVIFIDEATEFLESQFKMLLACLRGVNDFPKRVYLTCNPGGVGHAWVKRLFISRQYKAGEDPEDYLFIPAKATDNKSLMEADPDYLKRLQNLPEDLRRAWLDGDWDVFAGQYFSEWRREIHVAEPFAIPEGWRWYGCLDYGLDMLAAYLAVTTPEGDAYVVSEVFEGRENEKGESAGGHVMSAAAKRVREMAAGRQVRCWFAPPDLWNRRQDSGRSAAEVFAAAGLPLAKSSNNRVQGWLDMKEWLQPRARADGTKDAKLRVFSNCANLIESIPALVYDDKNPSDCASEPHVHTHGPDAIRYLIAGRPQAAAGGGAEPDSYDEQLDGFINYGA